MSLPIDFIAKLLQPPKPKSELCKMLSFVFIYMKCVYDYKATD